MKAIIAISFVVITQLVNAQIFQKLIGNSGDNRLGKVISHQNNFYVIGKNGIKATVTKLDNNGNIIWSNETNDEASWSDIIVNKDGNLMMVGNWGSTSATEDNYCLAGLINASNGTFVKLQTYNLGFRELFFRIFENPVPANVSFPYYVTGSKTESLGTLNDDLMLLNFDNNFNLREGREYSNSGDDEEYFRDIFLAGQNGTFMTIGNRIGSSRAGATIMFSKSMDVISKRKFDQSVFFTTGLAFPNPLSGFYQILAGGTSDATPQAVILRVNGNSTTYSYKIPFLKVINKLSFGNANNIYAVGIATIGSVDKTVVLNLQDNGTSLSPIWAKILDQSESAFSNGYIDFNFASSRLLFTDSRNGNTQGFGNFDGLLCVEDANFDNCLDIAQAIALDNNPMTIDTFPLSFEPFFEPPVTARTGSNLVYQSSVPCTPPCNIELFITETNNDICGSVTFTASPVGGTPPYMYSWDIGCNGTVDGSINPFTTTIGPGTQPYCITVTDANMCEIVLTNQTIIGFNDTQKPIITCPSQITLNCDQDYTDLMVTGTPSATDNIDQDLTISSTLGALEGSLCSGVAIRRFIATDDCNNSDTCYQTIFITDSESPKIKCPEPQILTCMPRDIPNYNFGTATGTDNCGTPSITRFDQIVTGNSCSGTIRNRWRAIDACGLQNECDQIITVMDNIDPTISGCGRKFTIDGVSGIDVGCHANFTISPPTVSDNCDATVALTNDHPSLIYNEGQTIVTWTATDDCGRMVMCRDTVVVRPCDTIDNKRQCGDAVVTCFPGFVNNTPSMGVTTTMPVLAIVNTNDYSASPLGSNWSSVSSSIYHPNHWNVNNLGQVFGTAIDGSDNIYAAASTVYGCDSPNFRQIGPAGFGGIYRIDPNDVITSFITTSATYTPNTTSLPNTGSGLGNVCFDKIHNQLFVSNFHDGMIYRISLASGLVVDRFDPFTSINSQSADNPNFVMLGERVWGLAHNPIDNRLYFGTWSEDRGRANVAIQNEIWSIGLTGTGGFATTCSGGTCIDGEILEIIMPENKDFIAPGGTIITTPYSNPISDVAFSHNNRMLIAERSMYRDCGDAASLWTSNTSLYNLAHNSRVLEYEKNSGSWNLTPGHTLPLINVSDYKFRLGNHAQIAGNSAGGVDYATNSFKDDDQPTLCDKYVWMTGDYLQCSVSDRIYGLQGSPANGGTGCTSTLIDYDNNIINSSSNRAKIFQGDVEIFKCIQCPAQDVCCIDSFTFNQTACKPLSITRDQCNVSISHPGLTTCQQITYTWGDGTPDTGPLTGTGNASHTYASSGDYAMCATIEEVDASGMVCFSKTICDTLCVTCTENCENDKLVYQCGNLFGQTNDDNLREMDIEMMSDGYLISASSKMNASGDADACIRVVNSSCSEEYKITFGSNGNDYAGGLKYDAANNRIIVAGYFSGDTMRIPKFGGGLIKLANSGFEDGFVASFASDLSGAHWAFKIGDTWRDAVEDIDLAGSDIYICGQARANLDFNPLGPPSNKECTFYTGFIAKYDKDGQLIWKKFIEPTKNANVIPDAIDVDGTNVYIGGRTESTSYYVACTNSLSIDGNNIGILTDPTNPLTTPRDFNNFIVKLGNLNGNYLDSRELFSHIGPTPGEGYPLYDILVDNGFVYATGHHFIGKYDANGNGLPAINEYATDIWNYDLQISNGKLYTFGHNYINSDQDYTSAVVNNQRKGNFDMALGVYDLDFNHLKSTLIGGENYEQGYGILVHNNDFYIHGTTNSTNFQPDPNDASTFLSHTSNNGGNRSIYIGKYSCDCQDEAVFACCDDVSASLTEIPTQGDSCCYSLDVVNDAAIQICEVEVDLITPGWTFNAGSVQYATNFILNVSTATSISLEHTSGNIPQGNLNDILQFCISGQSGSTNSQKILVKWYETQPDGSKKVVCVDTMTTDCVPKIDRSDCIQPVITSVTCTDDPLIYKVTFDVTNNSDFPIYQIVISNPDAGYNVGESQGGSFGSSVALSPVGIPILPGNSLTNVCLFIQTANPVLSPTTMCFQVGGKGFTDTSFECCTNPADICVELKPCCNPCTDMTVTADAADFDNEDKCCHSINFNNKCGYRVFNQIKLNILTPGVSFGNSVVGSGWTSSNQTYTSVCLSPVGSAFIPNGSVNDIYQFCFSDISSTTPNPQIVEITFIGLDPITVETFECKKQLEFNCEVSTAPCAIITNYEVDCIKEGMYNVCVDVLNVANPAFAASYIEILPITGGASISPSPVPLTPNPILTNQTGTACFNLNINPIPPSGKFIFGVNMVGIDSDSCCRGGFINLDTIMLPPCGDTIKCVCQDLKNLSVGNSTFNIPVICGASEPIILPCDMPSYDFYIHGDLICSDSSCNKSLTWSIKRMSDLFIVGSGTISPSTNHWDIVGLLSSNLTPGVLYQVSISGSCDGSTCSCTFPILKRACPPSCSCPSNPTFTLKEGNKNPVTIRCNDPVSATPILDCPYDDIVINGNFGCLSSNPNTPCPPNVISWTLDRPVSGNLSGTITGPNFNVSFPVNEVDEDGLYILTINTICGGDTCSCVMRWRQRECGTTNLCPDNIVQNGDFSIGLVAGPLNSSGAATNWDEVLESPDVVTLIGCQNPGAIQMWGNQTTGESITQLVAFSSGNTYDINLNARWLQENNRPYPAQVRLMACNGLPNAYNPSNCDLILISNPLDPFNCNNVNGTFVSLNNYSNLYITSWNNSSFNHGDSVTYVLVDDICITQRMIPQDTCCKRKEEFIATVSESVGLGIDGKNCDAFVHIDPLSSCIKIEKINWGDGNMTLGPLTSGMTYSHHYASSGNYAITVEFAEYNSVTGQKCFSYLWGGKSFHLDCSSQNQCNCKSLLVWLDNNHINCNSTNSIKCPNRKNVFLTAQLKCDSSKCGPNGLKYYVYKLNGPLVTTGSTNSSSFSLPLLAGWFDPLGGDYYVVFEGYCGTNKCQCRINIKVPPCPKDCLCDNNFIAEVEQGFNYFYRGNCEYKFTPKNICKNDKVKWTYNGDSISSTIGINPFFFTSSNTSPNEICMEVTRIDANGIKCKQKKCIRLKLCNITVPLPSDPCGEEELSNSDFRHGSSGLMNDVGKIDKWTLLRGEAYVIQEADSAHYVNMVSREGKPTDLHQNCCLAKDEKPRTINSFTIDVRNEGLSKIKEGVKLMLFAPRDVTVTDLSDRIAELDLSDISYDWQTKTFSGFSDPNWKYDNLVIRLHNPSNEDVSVGIVNPCADFIVATDNINLGDFKIYPNPTTSFINVDLSNIKSDVKTIQVSDALGRIISYQAADRGNTIYSIDLSPYSNGLYFVKVSSENRISSVKKIIKIE